MGLSRLRPKALVRYLDVICEEIITVVHENTAAVFVYVYVCWRIFLYLYYVLHLKKVVSDGIKIRIHERILPRSRRIRWLQALYTTSRIKCYWAKKILLILLISYWVLYFWKTVDLLVTLKSIFVNYFYERL